MQTAIEPLTTESESDASHRPEALERFERIHNERLADDEAVGMYQKMHLEWMLRLNYYIGNQGVSLDAETKSVREGDAPSWRSRYVANMIFPRVQRALAKLAGEDTSGRAAPAGPEHDDVVRARNAEQMLDHLRYVSGFSEERMMAVLWSTLDGTSAVKLWFDFDRGPRKRLLSQDGADLGAMQLGEVRAMVASPFGIRIPLHADREDELPWLQYSSWRDVDEVRLRFPHAAARINPIDTTDAVDFQADLRLRTLDSWGGGATAPQRTRVCRVTELWGRPCWGLKQGYKGILVNGKAVHVSVDKAGVIENPLVSINAPIPFIFYRYAMMPGRFWGIGLVELIERTQSEYNKTRADMVENVRLNGRPKVLNPKGSLVSKGSWTSQPGEIIDYNASAGVPTQVAPPPMPPFITDHMNQCLLEMAEIPGQTDAAEGKAPASVRSGVAIQLLQTAANETLGHARKLIAKADRDSYVMLLQLAQRFYAEDRTIATLGADKNFEVRLMKGSDLADPEAVRVFAEGGMFESKAARKQSILDSLQLGVFQVNDPSERLTLAAALEMGDVAPHLSEMLVDQRRADEENGLFEMLTKGELPAVPQARDFEDHVMHVRRHNLFRKGALYRSMDKDQQTIVDDHVALHQQFLAAQVMAQEASKAATRGGPGEKGTPSPPSSGKSGQAAKKTSGGGEE